jgi:hypothetical protein
MVILLKVYYTPVLFFNRPWIVRPFIDGFVPKAEVEPLRYKPVWTYQKIGGRDVRAQPEAAIVKMEMQTLESGMNKDINWAGACAKKNS